MLEQLLEYDTELFLFLNNLGNQTWDGFWLAYTYKFNWIPFYALLLFLLYRYLGNRNTLVLVIVVFFMVVFTDQVTNLVKRSVFRFRPCACEDIMHTMRYIAERCSTNRSFFSGHASNSMAIAIFVGYMLKNKYKYLIYFLIVWAFVMAYSRIYIGVHYPLDVVCGMLFGALSGYMFYKLYGVITSRLFEQK